MKVRSIGNRQMQVETEVIDLIITADDTFRQMCAPGISDRLQEELAPNMSGSQLLLECKFGIHDHDELREILAPELEVISNAMASIRKTLADRSRRAGFSVVK